MASNLMEVWGMSNQVMKVDIFVFQYQRYPKRFFVLLSQNLGSAKKWWCHSYPNMAILSKLNKMIMMMKVSSSWIKVLPNSSCCGQYTYLFNLNISTIWRMQPSHSWHSYVWKCKVTFKSHYWGLLLLHCVEVFYTRGSSSFFPSIIFFFARRERFAGSIVAITILS